LFWMPESWFNFFGGTTIAPLPCDGCITESPLALRRIGAGTLSHWGAKRRWTGDRDSSLPLLNFRRLDGYGETKFDTDLRLL
jgi:hypothetical protein